MAPEKVTEMVLNVDLKCSGCYKKVKKVICKIPQIRDQVFDVDKNKVKLIVVCCSPEKIRDKLCYKGGGAIQSIEIVEKSEKPKEAPADKAKPAAAAADKPKEADKPKPPPADKPKDAKPAADNKPAGKPKEPEKPKPADKPKDAEKPKSADKPKEPEKPKPAAAGDKPKDSGKPPEAKSKDAGKPPEGKPKDAEKPKQAEAPPKKVEFAPVPGANHPEVAKMVYEPVHGYPQMYPQSAYPMVEYGHYYDQGYGGGAAFHQHGYGMPVAVAPPPPPNYGGFGYEHGYNNGYNGNRGHYSNNDYGGEEEGEGCSIM